MTDWKKKNDWLKSSNEEDQAYYFSRFYSFMTYSFAFSNFQDFLKAWSSNLTDLKKFKAKKDLKFFSKEFLSLNTEWLYHIDVTNKILTYLLWMDSNCNIFYINEKSFHHPKLESCFIPNTLTEFNANLSQQILRLNFIILTFTMTMYI